VTLKTLVPAFTSLCLSLPGAARADIISLFTLDTTPLAADPAAPFSLDFQLNDGSGTGDGDNTAVLSGFRFGSGGGPAGSASLVGGASGDPGSSVTLTDTGFLNEFTQSFTPGATLQFLLNLSTNVDNGGFPDQFTFAILDSSGAQLPTLSFFDVFVEIDIDSADPTIQAFASDPSRSTVAGEAPIDLAAPTFTSMTSVPEPGATLLVLAGLFIFGAIPVALKTERLYRIRGGARGQHTTSLSFGQRG
jgi:hypothetical protein